MTFSQYREEIDGIRALAVMSVVTFHAFPNLLPGGFSGVDIFFVISGYLITGVILNRLQNNNFIFGKFYINRIRRIFPALILVYIANLLIGWCFLRSDELKQLGEHVFYGSIFLSNFTLISERGYFDISSESKPLLHLWSLSVEEQFYIFFPMLLWVAWKIAKATRDIYTKLTVMLMSVWIASFCFNIASTGGDSLATSLISRAMYFLLGPFNSDRTVACYSPLTRAWELSTGSLLALTEVHRTEFKNSICSIDSIPNFNKFSIERYEKINRNHNFVKDLISLCGLAVIITSFLFINKDNHFPGWYALPPVLGTAMLISAGKKGLINRTLLNNPILVYIGLISYPFYLWHWPILSFAKILNGETPNLWIRGAGIFVAFILASLTYHFVERPIRIHGFLKTKYLFLLMASFGMLGYVVNIKNGYEFRTVATPTAMLDGDIGQNKFYEQLDIKFYKCNAELIYKHSLVYDGYTRCYQSIKDESVEVALIGDSHAEHLFPGLAMNLTSINVAYYIKGNLPFLANDDFKEIFEHVLRNKEIKTVVIAGHWISRPKQLNFNSFAETIKALTDSGKTIYIAGDIPKFSFDPVKCKFEKRIFFFENKCEEEVAVFKAQLRFYSPVLVEILHAFPAVRFLDLSKHFCDTTICSMSVGNQILYRDHDHLNIQGSNYLGKKIIEFNPDLKKILSN